MTVAIPAQSEWLRTSVKANDVGVDRDKKRILGMVMAQEGTFLEDDPRGRFDAKSLKKIVTLARKKPSGLKSRFTHPSLSGDGLGTFLGRVKNVRLDSVSVERGGELKSLLAVRGDLHLADAAFNSPNGDLGTYVMDLAAEDSDALSSSLVLKPAEEQELDSKGNPVLDPVSGEPLPPLWRPIELHASDIVDQGAAVDGLLSAYGVEGLKDDMVRKGFALLTNFLPGQPREVVEVRLSSWMKKALDLRYAALDDEDLEEDVEIDEGEFLAKPVALFERRLRLRRRIGA